MTFLKFITGHILDWAYRWRFAIGITTIDFNTDAPLCGSVIDRIAGVPLYISQRIPIYHHKQAV